jgi:hypothetical protein
VTVSAGTALRRAATRVARRVDLSPLTEWRGRGVPPGLRTAKTTLAAVISCAWQVHGHLLANVDRLLSELDPEGQTWPGLGRPS